MRVEWDGRATLESFRAGGEPARKSGQIARGEMAGGWCELRGGGRGVPFATCSRLCWSRGTLCGDRGGWATRVAQVRVSRGDCVEKTIFMFCSKSQPRTKRVLAIISPALSTPRRNAFFTAVAATFAVQAPDVLCKLGPWWQFLHS